MKNTKAFTLVELLAVLVILGLVMFLVLPNLDVLRSSNSTKQYTSYEDMMIEYTKTLPNYKKKSYVCLKDLDMPKINENINCNGYVNIIGNRLDSYLRCVQNGDEVYKKDGFNLPSDC